MPTIEIRNADRARTFVLQSLVRQSILPLHAETVVQVLDWGVEYAASGEPLPPLGFLADVGHLLFGTRLPQPVEAACMAAHHDWPAGLTRAYEDYVLGKFYGDGTFDRCAAAICRYQGRDRIVGFSFLMAALQRRAGFGGVSLTPASLKSLTQMNPSDLVAAALEAQAAPLVEGLTELYDELIETIRLLGWSFTPEDVFEVEHRAALMSYSERLQLRQVFDAIRLLEPGLPVRPPPRRTEQAQQVTHLQDESSYPVGGFSSISTRGTIESLLHSQLAYMEVDERPDMFDIKFLRDELLYYSRDESQFFRRRRTFIFELMPDLVLARVKDAALPCQRIVLALAAITIVIRRMIDWLSEEALSFQIVFVDGAGPPLLGERRLIELLFREQIANGTVRILEAPRIDLARLWAEAERRSLCQGVVLTTSEQPLPRESDSLQVLRLSLNPVFQASATGPTEAAGEVEPLTAWHLAVSRWLETWI